MSARILIVDDHAVVRAGLAMLVNAERDLDVVGEAGSAREAIFEARTTKPDVVLMDVMMPDQSGIEVVPQLLHELPDAKVLVLSMQDDPRYVREAFEAGASGYVLKEAADTELVAAIKEVAGGGRYVHPELVPGLFRPRRPSVGARRRTRSPTVSTRSCACSRWATRTRRSRRSSTSRCARPKRTGRTSCRSYGSPAARSSFATHWTRASWNLLNSERAARRRPVLPATEESV